MQYGYLKTILAAAETFSYRFFFFSLIPRHIYLPIGTSTFAFLSVFKHQQACYEQKEWEQTSNIQQFKL